MSAERYVVLGLARPRAGWFAALARWSTTGLVPVEFVKCVSDVELRARLAGGGAVSAVLVDGVLPAVDRDLLEEVTDSGAAALVVDHGSRRDWRSLGATAVLPGDLDHAQLLDTLATHAPLVGAGGTSPGALPAAPPESPAGPVWRATLVAVCGPGGTGASTVAAALAQGLAGEARHAGLVVLADLCRHAEQGMLHDVGDVTPGIQELVDAHRGGQPTVDEIRAHTFLVGDRGYHLLLGLRRAAQWNLLRPRSVDAAVASLRQSFRVVVADVDDDLEGEESGAPDLADRNALARAATGSADVVVVVGAPGTKGLHSLARLRRDVVDFGVEPARVLPVVNRAPRGRRARAAIVAALGELGAAPGGPSAVFLPDRPVEAAVRGAGPLPEPLPRLLAGAVGGLTTRQGLARARSAGDPQRVEPGSLGAWAEG